jgi:hypothetical protein
MAARPRVHQSERNAGPSSSLSLCCLKRDIHECAPIVAVLTFSCLAMKTNGCMRRVRPFERYQARSQSCRCVHVMISLCVLRNKLLLVQYSFFEADGKPGFQSNANQARIPMFRTHNYNVRNPCFQPNAIGVCFNPIRRSQSIKVTQFNQMAFWFFLGWLDCGRNGTKIPALETMLLGFLWSGRDSCQQK